MFSRHFAENILEFFQTSEFGRNNQADPISFSEPQTQVNFKHIQSYFKFSSQPNSFDRRGNIWVIGYSQPLNDPFIWKVEAKVNLTLETKENQILPR